MVLADIHSKTKTSCPFLRRREEDLGNCTLLSLTSILMEVLYRHMKKMLLGTTITDLSRHQCV